MGGLSARPCVSRITRHGESRLFAPCQHYRPHRGRCRRSRQRGEKLKLKLFWQSAKQKHSLCGVRPRTPGRPESPPLIYFNTSYFGLHTSYFTHPPPLPYRASPPMGAIINHAVNGYLITGRTAYDAVPTSLSANYIIGAQRPEFPLFTFHFTLL